MYPTEPIVPGPGQESVWGYPRPPRLELTREHVVITYDGTVICKSKRAVRVLETSHPPVYYLPVEDFMPKVFKPAKARSECEWKGAAYYVDISVKEGPIAANAAWGYREPLPGYEALRGRLAVYAAAMDEVTVDGEIVVPQPGGFYGGWITSKVVGPFKGVPGSSGW